MHYSLCMLLSCNHLIPQFRPLLGCSVQHVFLIRSVFWQRSCACKRGVCSVTPRTCNGRVTEKYSLPVQTWSDNRSKILSTCMSSIVQSSQRPVHEGIFTVSWYQINSYEEHGALHYSVITLTKGYLPCLTYDVLMLKTKLRINLSWHLFVIVSSCA